MRQADRVKMAVGTVEAGSIAVKTMSGAGKRFRWARTRAAVLCLALCFVLGAVPAGQALAKSVTYGTKEEGTGAYRYLKKDWPPYFYEGAIFYKLAWSLQDAFFQVPAEYYRSDETLHSLLFQYFRTDACLWLVRDIAFKADKYMYGSGLAGLRRMVAWQALGGIIEPMYLYGEAYLRKDRELLEALVVQRQAAAARSEGRSAPLPALRNIINHYKDMEGHFAFMARDLRHELARNLTRLPPEISRVFDSGAAPEDILPGPVNSASSESAFWSQIQQRRMAIGGQLEAIIAHAGMKSDKPFSVALPVSLRWDIESSLDMAEAWTGAVCAQLEVNRRLLSEFRVVADAAVRRAGMEFIDELLNDLNSSAETAAEYFAPTIPVFADSLDLLRIFKKHMAGHGK